MRPFLFIYFLPSASDGRRSVAGLLRSLNRVPLCQPVRTPLTADHREYAGARATAVLYCVLVYSTGTPV